eukprot:g18766.t1
MAKVKMNALSTCRSAPEVSFKSRYKVKDKDEAAPGPGKYGVPSCDIKYRRTLDVSFGASTRLMNKKWSGGAPGPGAYSPFMPNQSGRTCSFGTGPRLPKAKETDGPPPGNYPLRSSLNTKAVYFAGKPEGKLGTGKSPDPGAYKLNMTQVYKTQPVPFFGSESREKALVRPSNGAPGPGHYPLMKELGGNVTTHISPCFSFQGRRKPPRSGAGDGAYAETSNMAGYGRLTEEQYRSFGTEIFPKLFLTSCYEAQDQDFLKKHGITTFGRTESVLPALLFTLSTFHCVIRRGRIYYHTSRKSSTLSMRAAARERCLHHRDQPVLTLEETWTLETALARVKSVRSLVDMNIGFLKQLCDWERQLSLPSPSVPLDQQACDDLLEMDLPLSSEVPVRQIKLVQEDPLAGTPVLIRWDFNNYTLVYGSLSQEAIEDLQPDTMATSRRNGHTCGSCECEVELTEAQKKLPEQLKALLGAENVKSNVNVRGSRLGKGTAMLVLKPGTLREALQALELCAKAEVAVLPQGANTSLTGGSVPRNDCDRPFVIINMRRAKKIMPVGDTPNLALCFAGAGIFQLQTELQKRHRDSHSVLGSMFLNPSVAAGVSYGSGGTQIRKDGLLKLVD